MSLIQIKHAIRLLSLSQLRKFDEWLHELIRKSEEAERLEKSSSRKQKVSKQAADKQTYRLERIRCGKEKCKCKRGKLHGPYWYSYTRTNNKVTSQYIGKSLPEGVEKKFRGQINRRNAD